MWVPIQRPRKTARTAALDYVDTTVFGDHAEVCNQYLAKTTRPR